jgi:uncharacterized protein (TIGR02594 family)
MTLPAAYAWLEGLTPLPRMIAEGIKLYGVKEAPGRADNPTILAWAAETGLSSVYQHDETAWCGLFAALVAKRAGKPVVAGPLWALNWQHFGVTSPQAGLGDILVFVRPGGGHVGLYIAEDDGAYHVLGGNTADTVSIARIAKDRLRAARRPVYNVQPATVKPYIVAASGALSTNEA